VVRRFSQQVHSLRISPSPGYASFLHLETPRQSRVNRTRVALPAPKRARRVPPPALRRLDVMDLYCPMFCASRWPSFSALACKGALVLDGNACYQWDALFDH
jgi:hypothetical protein